MKALILKRYGGLDQVAFADIPRPVPKPNEILVQVNAAGLNPIDNMILKGTFRPILRFRLPATLGSDLAAAGAADHARSNKGTRSCCGGRPKPCRSERTWQDETCHPRRFLPPQTPPQTGRI